MEISDINATRFSGFAGLYDSARPECPAFAAEFLCSYLGRAPQQVVDIGCGTGKSTLLWAGRCPSVIGVEPNSDMLSVARENAKRFQNLRFVQALSNETGLPGLSADLVTCSQSFHWMEPRSTLREISRILRPGGIFAAYDCDWPAVFTPETELAYEELFAEVGKIEKSTPKIRDSFVRWDKNEHLKNIRESGFFRYAREIVFYNTEPCDAARYIGLAMSQGSLQAALREKIPAIPPLIERFSETVRREFGNQTREIGFCYRMRFGVK